MFEQKNIRPEKGKCLLSPVDDYVVVDLETTGLDPAYDEIIELCAVRVKNNMVSDAFCTLVKPNDEIDDFIENLTGITNEMVANAPLLYPVLCNFLDFIGDSIIVGHNINFDINFLYDKKMEFLNSGITNNFIDTMRLARILYPGLKHHRLSDMVDFLKINHNNSHRAYSDCIATIECYKKMQNDILNKYGTFSEFEKQFKQKNKHSKLNIIDITTKNTEFDETNLLFNKTCVFTGVLERMPRKTAMQIVVDLGGKIGSTVTKTTDFLILGNNDYNPILRGAKSSKQKRAEELKLNGCGIEIISENVFYDIIEQ